MSTKTKLQSIEVVKKEWPSKRFTIGKDHNIFSDKSVFHYLCGSIPVHQRAVGACQTGRTSVMKAGVWKQSQTYWTWQRTPSAGISDWTLYWNQVLWSVPEERDRGKTRVSTIL